MKIKLIKRFVLQKKLIKKKKIFNTAQFSLSAIQFLFLITIRIN